MKKTAIAVLAIFMSVSAAACGSFGKSSPQTVTKKNDTSRTSTTAQTSMKNDKTPTDADDTESASDTESENETGTSHETDAPESDEELIEDLIDKMTLEEKVGQLFLVRPDALETGFENSVVNNDDIGGVTYVDDMMKNAMEKYHVGGFVLFEKNIVDGEQLKKFTDDLQGMSEIPLLIGVNELGGDFAPIANNVNFNVKLFGNMNELGATGSAEKAKNVGTEIGKYLAEYGLNFDFAPRADLSLDSKKVSAGNFSSDAGVASNMVSAEIEGLHASGIMAAVSHFPGYGDNTADNDNFIYNGSLWETILERDAVPFVDSLSKTDMLVIGHVELPAVTDDGFPASMSQQFIQEKVRDELGYKGVIMTDSMAAKSVKKNYVQSECAVEAVIAGADIVLTPYDLDKAYRSVLKAAEDGKIDESRINGSVRRILALKAKSGLLDDHKISEE